MKTDLVKGFKDSEGEDALKRAEIKKLLVDTFEKYGFNPTETPVIEYEEFVKGENKNDEAVSDIFKLQDKGKRKLALRYELTFQLKRLIQNKKLPFKRYQIGEVFRDEPVSGNRFRQFTQCDVDVVGSSLKDDAELLSLAKEILEKLGIEFIIYFNNRNLLNEILESGGISKREEVIKELDKLDKIPEKEVIENLKKLGAEKILNLFKKKESLEKYSNYSEIKEIEKYLKDYGVQAEFQPTLSRGLSYYNKTVFEIKVRRPRVYPETFSKKGLQGAMKESIVAGGAYQFNGIQCAGISFGLDRLSMLSNIKITKPRVLIVSLNEDKKAIEIAGKLRGLGNCVSMFYGKPSKALEYANSYDIEQVIFVGAEEVKKKQYKIKDMKTGKEKILTFEKKIKKNVIVQRK